MTGGAWSSGTTTVLPRDNEVGEILMGCNKSAIEADARTGREHTRDAVRSATVSAVTQLLDETLAEHGAASHPRAVAGRT
jgi:hypothetical protein